MTQGQARLSRFLRHLADQVSIANDIASYEKEQQQFLTSKTTHIINVVHVIKEVEHIDDEAAKSMAYAWQLWNENEILKELEVMRREDGLSLAEWRFIDASLAAAAGNCFTSIVMSRYGGEDARVCF